MRVHAGVQQARVQRAGKRLGDRHALVRLLEPDLRQRRTYHQVAQRRPAPRVLPDDVKELCEPA